MTPRSLLVALASFACLVGCNARISVDGTGGGGNDGCSELPPYDDESCPPAWECIDGEWVDAAGACPEVECPETQPADGEPCPRVGASCNYVGEEPCGPQADVTATCTERGWTLLITYCQPEPTCPDAMPEVGSDCSGWDYPYYCEYPLACSEPAVVALSCDYSTPTPTWKVNGETPACGSCSAANDPSSCAANLGCTWHEPGCASETQTPIAAGCYPVGDCRYAESCNGPNEICEVFVANPCFGSMCTACGAEIGVCVAP
jgi:hypothetical protein